MLVTSIVQIQILAYLSLSDINIPASALEGFKILIEIVSFDFFEPFEYLDVGFTSTESWSP